MGISPFFERIVTLTSVAEIPNRFSICRSRPSQLPIEQRLSLANQAEIISVVDQAEIISCFISSFKRILTLTIVAEMPHRFSICRSRPYQRRDMKNKTEFKIKATTLQVKQAL